MEFKEPKVEMIRIEKNEVFFTSTGAGGVQGCTGSIPTDGCSDDKMNDLNTQD